MQKSSSFTSLALALLFTSSIILVGCSSSPDEAQMKQMSDLKEETSAMEKEIGSKDQDIAKLEKDIADKNAKLKKCNDDQAVVKQRLGK